MESGPPPPDRPESEGLGEGPPSGPQAPRGPQAPPPGPQAPPPGPQPRPAPGTTTRAPALAATRPPAAAGRSAGTPAGPTGASGPRGRARLRRAGPTERLAAADRRRAQRRGLGRPAASELGQPRGGGDHRRPDRRHPGGRALPDLRQGAPSASPGGRRRVRLGDHRSLVPVVPDRRGHRPALRAGDHGPPGRAQRPDLGQTA